MPSPGPIAVPRSKLHPAPRSAVCQPILARRGNVDVIYPLQPAGSVRQPTPSWQRHDIGPGYMNRTIESLQRMNLRHETNGRLGTSLAANTAPDTCDKPGTTADHRQPPAAIGDHQRPIETTGDSRGPTLTNLRLSLITVQNSLAVLIRPRPYHQHRPQTTADERR